VPDVLVKRRKLASGMRKELGFGKTAAPRRSDHPLDVIAHNPLDISLL
jgi:hypothetical protein